MILYFNCKIISGKLYSNSKETFYPFPLPVNEKVKDPFLRNLSILKKTLLSYSRLNFKKSIFNIEIEKSGFEDDIKKIILQNFKSKEISINFSRPSNLQDWIDDINNISNNLSEIIFTCFNHDHPFIDSQIQTFQTILKEFNKILQKEYKSIFYYSHIPEIFEKNIDNSFAEKVIDNQIIRLKKTNYSVDSFALMSLQTLKYIFDSIIKAPDYFGRPDWPGLYFKKLNITSYFSPREFFTHYDGYNHVTGLRIYKNYLLFDHIKKDDLEYLTNYYYSRWLNISFLYIKYSVNKRFRVKKKLITAIENSFEIFRNSYINEDEKNNVFDKKLKSLIIYNLKNKMYYNLNDIFQKLNNDIMLGHNENKVRKKIIQSLKNSFFYQYYIKLIK